MIRLFLCLFVLGFVAARDLLLKAQSCPLEWTFFMKTEACYTVVDESVTLQEAEDYCALSGAHLVSIHSPEENRFVWSLAAQHHTIVYYWIGAKQNSLTKVWQWSDGTKLNYTNWLGTNGVQAAMIYPTAQDTQLKWYRLNKPDAEAHHWFICKKFI